MKQERLDKILELARRKARAGTPVVSGAVVSGAVVPELRPGLAASVAARWARTAPEGDLVLWDQVTRWGLAMAAVVCVVSFVMRQREPELPSTPFDQWVLGTEEGGRG